MILIFLWSIGETAVQEIKEKSARREKQHSAKKENLIRCAFIKPSGESV